MITKIKILKDAGEAQMTATVVTDCQFVDAWLNLDHVLVVMPDPSMNLLRVRFSGAQSIAITYDEWERVAKLHGFHEWTDDEQHIRDYDPKKHDEMLIAAANRAHDKIMQDAAEKEKLHRADVDMRVCLNWEQISRAKKAATEYLDERDYCVFSDRIVWRDNDGSCSQEIRGFTDLMEFAKDRGFSMKSASIFNGDAK